MFDHVVIERVGLGSSDPINTNNHPPDQAEAHLDYRTEVDRTRLSNYHDIIDYPTIARYTLTDEDVALLERSGQMCIFTGKLPQPLETEYKQFIEQIENTIGSTTAQIGLFIRLDGSSPKDGALAWPLMSAREIVRQIATSKRAHQCISHGDRVIYMCRFDRDWDTLREIRCFVHRGRLTAISQYACYEKQTPIGDLTDQELSAMASSVADELQSILPALIRAFGGKDDFVCDAYVNPDLSCRIIEFNSFGYWLAAGSALFHWIRDRDKLYNDQGTVWIRVADTN